MIRYWMAYSYLIAKTTDLRLLKGLVANISYRPTCKMGNRLIYPKNIPFNYIISHKSVYQLILTYYFR